MGNISVKNLFKSKSENSMQRIVEKSGNTVHDESGSELRFNIGPLFLHVTSFNRYTGHSFNYFYESKMCKNFVEDNLNRNISKVPSIGLTSINSLLNHKKHSVRVNIYKEKCFCEKHLSRTFLFFGSEATELRNELLKMLVSCEDFKTWDDKWIKIIIEQMCLFFSCIKESKVYERLLESAGLCAKMMLIKDFRKELIEFKYSYITFHRNFADKITEKMQQENQKDGKRESHLNSNICGEEIDVIDGFAILSFETEEEMNQYIQLEKLNRRGKPPLKFPNVRNNVRKNTNSTEIMVPNKKQKTKERTIVPDDVIKITEITQNRNLVVPKSYFNKKKHKIWSYVEQTSESDFHYNKTNNSNQNIETCKLTEDRKNCVNKYPKKELEKFDKFFDSKGNLIPIIHGCDKNKNLESICRCKHFSLFMVLTIGKGRPFSKGVVENLNYLEMNNNKISFRMASIAASALVHSNRRTVKRILVPVKTSKLKSETKFLRNKTDKFIKDLTNKLEIDPVVKEVVNFMVDYVAINLDYEDNKSKKQSVKFFKRNDNRKKMTKIQRELNKLSASFTDEDSPDISATNCGNESCKVDCECQNQNGKNNLITQCEKESCFISCVCKKREENVPNLAQIDCPSNQSCGVDEEAIRKFHANIKILDGKKFGLTNLVHRSNRPIKLSTRFKNSVLFDEASLIVTSTPRRRLKSDSTEDRVDSSKSEKGTIKKSDLLVRRLNFCEELIKSKKTLGDVFIWCDRHRKYNCTCISWVCRMKYNALIFKPKKHQKYLAHKQMMKLELFEKSKYEVFFFDTQSYSARTYGAPINYALRNRTSTFKAKRMFELKKGIISSTNSYIKKNFSIYKILDSENKTEQEYEVHKSPTVENLHLKPENIYSTELIEVCEQNLQNEDTVIILSDSDEDIDHGGNNIIDHIKSVYNTTLNSTETLENVLKGLKNINEEEYKQTDTMLKNTLSRKKGVKLMEEALGDHAFSEDNSESHHSEIENPKDMSFQRTDAAQFLEQNSFDIDNNYDPCLENELIQLEDHPLKNQIYGSDNLPKLSLYCLTPGIGYLPIVEYGTEVLVVQDPVSPLLLHSFKNLNCANIWLNKFLKDFLVFESIDICLKWVIVKPGIIKLKKSLPFTPAILENSSIIITKDGELVFNKDLDIIVNSRKKYQFDSTSRGLPGTEIKCSESILDRKRKFSHSDSDDVSEKRKKVQPVTPIVVKRPINMTRYYPGKKPTTQLPTTQLAVPSNPRGLLSNKKSDKSMTGTIVKKYISIVKTTPQRNSNIVQLKIDSPNLYRVIPGNLLVSNSNVTGTLLLPHNGKNSGEHSSKIHVVTDPVSGASKILTSTSTPYIVSNNNSLLTNKNVKH